VLIIEIVNFCWAFAQMQLRNIIQTALLTGGLSMTMMAADVAGKWTAEVPGRNGAMMQKAIVINLDGKKMSGTVAGGQGDPAKIEEGMLEGDTVTFKVNREFNGNKMTWTYTGKVSANAITFKREGGRAPVEFTAKRDK